MAAHRQSSRPLTAQILSFPSDFRSAWVPPGFYLPLVYFLAKGLETQSEMTGDGAGGTDLVTGSFEQLAREREWVNFFSLIEG